MRALATLLTFVVFSYAAWGQPPVVPSAQPDIKTPPKRFVEAEHQGGKLEYHQGIAVLTVQGTPEEIGEQFGVLAVKNAPDIDGLRERFLRDAGVEQAELAVMLMARRLQSGFPTDHLTEITTAAKVAEKKLDHGLFANTVYDLSSSMGCSTLVVEKERSRTGEPMLARNFDWMPTQGIVDHTMLMVAKPKGKRAFCVLTISPIVGCISGMNDAGLSCTLNEIHVKQSREKAPFNWDGTPTMLAFRRVLEECTTVAEAEKLLNEMKRTTTACLTICDTEGGAVFEITPKSIQVRKPVAGVTCCTNHFCTDELGLDNPRCNRLPKLLLNEAGNGKLGVDELFAELHKVHQKQFTLQSMVFEPKTRKFHLKLGDGRTTASSQATKTFDLSQWFDAN